VSWPELRGVFHADDGRRWAAARGTVGADGTSCHYAVIFLRAGQLAARAVVAVTSPAAGSPLRPHVFDQLEAVARKRPVETPADAPLADARHQVLEDKYCGGGLWELEERTTFRVIDRARQVVLLELTGEASASYTGSGTWDNYVSGGVWKVTLDPDGEHAWIHDHARARRAAIPGTAAHAADLAAREGPPCPRCGGSETRRAGDGGRCPPCGLDWTDEPGPNSAA
jgi:hypothetical protein